MHTIDMKHRLFVPFVAIIAMALQGCIAIGPSEWSTDSPNAPVIEITGSLITAGSQAMLQVAAGNGEFPDVYIKEIVCNLLAAPHYHQVRLPIYRDLPMHSTIEQRFPIAGDYLFNGVQRCWATLGRDLVPSYYHYGTTVVVTDPYTSKYRKYRKYGRERKYDRRERHERREKGREKREYKSERKDRREGGGESGQTSTDTTATTPEPEKRPARRRLGVPPGEQPDCSRREEEPGATCEVR